MSALYQAGLGPDIVLNMRPIGVSDNNRISIALAENLNFRNWFFQIVRGKVRLLGYTISGAVECDIAYSNGGEPAPEAGAKRPGRPPKCSAAAVEGGAGDQEFFFDAEGGDAAAAECAADGADGDLADLPGGSQPTAVRPDQSGGTKRPRAKRPDDTVMEEKKVRKASATAPPGQNIAFLDEPGGGAGLERVKRVTTKSAVGLRARLPAGTSLVVRLEAVRTSIQNVGAAGANKLSLWPVRIAYTSAGRVRVKWSAFACVACTDRNFFRELGFDRTQIHSFDHGGVQVYSLGPKEGDGGDVVASGRIFPNNTSPPGPDHYFYLIPRENDIVLKLQGYLDRVPATPAALQGVFEQMLAVANYRYRTAVLQMSDAVEDILLPRGARIIGNAVAGLSPENIFPIAASFVDSSEIKLVINTARGQGSVKAVRFGEDNVFGMPAEIKAWRADVDKFERVTVVNGREVGVPEQECEITSNEMYLARATIDARGVSESLCAAFLSDDPRQHYFPRNQITPSTYNSINLNIRSRHAHPSIVVKDEKYAYSLVCEMRQMIV